ncbi:ADP-ribosylglycohydrolase family protein [Butyrivibrio sp. YAB3001]|uniref:ADP-ribosylglycohydrolase family protein n=1 Tax=Butyrivibrio sp. YAB3001 TaxID=1520812 RepID=UPI0008F6850F|nr:ADP-ribosylglycohydrolase family protein [Butyrivibrio sp. YAB3001]SFC27647.1 ADP-ribosylglycohydrolase [Butyrivibrio sp. YAB3001]
MIGAIIGDMVGSIYEFNNIKDKRFFLLTKCSTITDDSFMTMAISRALLDCDEDIKEKRDGYEQKLYDKCIEYMVYYGRRFPDAGYGSRFAKWLKDESRKPYGSYGNGSAMRVSPVGWFCDSLEDTLRIAVITASPSHNHEEGIKGAQAIAAGIYLLRTGSSKDEFKKYITDTFGYNLDRKLDDIRPDYSFHVSCEKSVPEAIIAFLEGESFEDVIRNAVSLGGDSDTIACMAGALAEAIYEIPEEIRASVKENLIEQREVTRKDFDFYNLVVIGKKSKAFGEQSFNMPNPWEYPLDHSIEEFYKGFHDRLRDQVEINFENGKRVGTIELMKELYEEIKVLEPGKGCDKRLLEIAEYFGYIKRYSTCMKICDSIIESGADAETGKKANQLKEDLRTFYFISRGIISWDR